MLYKKIVKVSNIEMLWTTLYIHSTSFCYNLLHFSFYSIYSICCKTFMLFNSFEFILIFLPLTLLGFYILKTLHKYTLAKLFLIGSSLFFYGYFKIEYTFILLSSIFINYILAKLILKSLYALALKKVCINGGGGG
ncbi:alginate O- acetylation protein [Helicobacter muridarum]|uniref:Alginate O- acetylation protein n=2 Tax=Helicobacter muridarum TaxID=216 RepID=A0A377PW93_9HELI|nr:alginate O- acetylation protein [Helicobacter muridarum]